MLLDALKINFAKIDQTISKGILKTTEAMMNCSSSNTSKETEMMEDARKAELLGALNLLQSARYDEKEELFTMEIQKIDRELAKLEEKEDPF